MLHRLVGRSMLFTLALALAACGGGGGGGGSVPAPTPTPVPGGSTMSFTASTSGAIKLVFGVSGGIGATIWVPPTTSGSGSGSATLSPAPPSGVPAVSSAARMTQSVGGTIVPLAYLTVTANSALSFAQTPAVTLTTPNTSSQYAYIAYYTGSTWTAVAGPGTLVGGNYVINPTDDNYSIAAGQSAVFAIFGSATLINVNPPSSPTSDLCPSNYKRASNGHRFAPQSTSQVVANRLYVSYNGSTNTQTIAHAVGAIRTFDLKATKGVAHTVVTLPPGANHDQAAATLRAQSGVVAVSNIHTRSLLSDTQANDPGLDNVDQWYLYRTAADPVAWTLTHGAGVNIAVIDTGVDMTNPDFPATTKLVKAESIVGGMITSSAQDTNGHGTNVAGLAAAATNNAYGFASVGWAVGLLDYKIFPDANAYSDCQGADTGDEAAAVDDAVSSGASVISLSLGSPNSSGADAAEQDAIDLALAAKVAVVAAAGNEYDGEGNGTLLDYPAAYPGVIAVGASAVFDSQMNNYSAITSEQVASYSNSGPTLIAPGGDALADPSDDCTTTTSPCDVLHWIEGYSTTSAGLPADRCSNTGGLCIALFNGTSQATPQVAATVALMMAEHGGARSLTPSQVTTILTTTTDVLPGISSTRQGAGRLNVGKAVAGALP